MKTKKILLMTSLALFGIVFNSSAQTTYSTASSYFGPAEGGTLVLKQATTTSLPYLAFSSSNGAKIAKLAYDGTLLSLIGSDMAFSGTKLIADNTKGIEFLHSGYGNGFGAKIYGTDDGNGGTTMRFGVRANATNFTDAMTIKTTGQVGIGGVVTFPTTVGGANVTAYKVFVKGGILTEEVRVALNSTWADYVFAKEYALKPLSQVEEFITINGHLPNVPSAKQVKEEGINVADMARIQQEKIEELTLYIIAQNKRIEALEAKMNNK